MSQLNHNRAKYTDLDWGEMIEGTKEEIQSFGIGIGRAFPGEANGPKRQLWIRDPRGFNVQIRETYWPQKHYCADIYFSNIPARPKFAESTPFHGVRKTEAYWYDEFSGRVEHLIAAGLVDAVHLPGAPGMRKTRVTIKADGSVLSGKYSTSIPGGSLAGLKHIERASPKSATVTVRIHIDRPESDRREAQRQIAESAWLHEVRKLPRPRKLTAIYAASIAQQAHAASAAKSDSAFQAFLGKLAQLPAGEAS